MRTALPLRPSLQSLPPCTGASELHSYPARAIGSRVITRSCAVRAHHEPLFGDLSATTCRLALGREVRARPVPRERTRPFLARSRHHSHRPPLTLPSLSRAAVSGPSLRYIETSRPATVSHARRRAIRRATPCMIIAGGSGARATADSASPHALWPAAARCRAPCLRRIQWRPDSRL